MILLYIYQKIKTNNYRQNTDEDSKNLSVTSINNCETSENNVLRTTETPKNDVLNDDLAAPAPKKKFPTNTTPFKLCSTETEFNKRKNSSPIVRELNTPVCNKAVEGFFK